MLDASIVEKTLNAALENGADFAEIYAEDTHSDQIRLTDGRVEDAAYARLTGVGIRVAKGLSQSYAYTADCSEEALLFTARASAAGLEKGDPTAAQPIGTHKDYGQKQTMPFTEVTNDRRVAVIRRMAEAAKAVDPRIVQTAGTFMDVTKHVLVANSLGVWGEEVRPRTRVALQAIASDGTVTQTGAQSPGFGRDFSCWADFDAESYGKKAAQTALTMLTAPECPAGVMPVVIGNGFGGVIFHEACAHSLEATAVARGASEFCGKIGQKIAADCVTAVDDGTLAGEWGSLNMDDEGNPTQRNVLIENGILKSYLVDALNGRRMGMAATGSCRRQNYEYAPTSRMTNTFFAPGTDAFDEMIATMGDGLYAAQMGGGSVNPLTGEFNFAVTEGYLVRDGKIVHPVRGATLVGRGSEILFQIDRIGSDFALGQGMCGSSSGSIPVNVGQPTIRVQNVIVGGKGGTL